MKEYIEERAVAITNYIIDRNVTVRQVTKKLGMSKPTVHKDVADQLEHINPILAAQARIILNINKSERHIRGDLAAREKCQHRLQMYSRETKEWWLGKGVFIDRRIFPARNCILSLMNIIQRSGGCGERDGHRI